MSWATLCERLRMLFSVGLSADVTADSLFLYLMQLFFFPPFPQGQVGEHAQDRPLRNHQYDAQRHHRRLRS